MLVCSFDHSGARARRQSGYDLQSEFDSVIGWERGDIEQSIPLKVSATGYYQNLWYTPEDLAIQLSDEIFFLLDGSKRLMYI